MALRGRVAAASDGTGGSARTSEYARQITRSLRVVGTLAAASGAGCSLAAVLAAPIALTLDRAAGAGGVSVTTRSGRLLTVAKHVGASTRRFAFRLPSVIRREQTLVLDTGAAFYAVGLRPT